MRSRRLALTLACCLLFAVGRVVLAANKDIADYSETQFFGTGARPADDSNWNAGAFVLNVVSDSFGQLNGAEPFVALKLTIS